METDFNQTLKKTREIPGLHTGMRRYWYGLISFIKDII